MSAELLTHDNILLSRSIMAQSPPSPCAINCTNELPPTVATYVQASLSDNTRRAYQSDLAHFEAWGGSIPATAETVAAYLANHARLFKVATLDRRLASISKAHEAGRFPNPTHGELVRATRRGIRRMEGTIQRRVVPLCKEDLCRLLSKMGNTAKDTRDKALLLIGFEGAFRRSELVSLDRKDIELTLRGLAICIRRSKTDQSSTGRRIGIPFGGSGHCPVAALEGWLSVAAIDEGPIFRRVDRHDNVLSGRLSSEAVALVIKQWTAAVGLDPDVYSGHSLRAGFVTDAALTGVPTWKIRQQTGHTSDAMLIRYIRKADLF